MLTNTSIKRLSAGLVGAAMLSVHIPVVFAAGNATMEWRPHCIDGDEVENQFGGPVPKIEGIMTLTDGQHCTSYQVRDPSSLQTPVLKTGDILDIDLVINNPDKKDINRFRAWVAYDPTVLEGMDFAVSSSFPIPTPGEGGFLASEGTLKLSGTAERSIDAERIPAARVRFKVLADGYDGTPLTFIEATGNSDSKTGAFEADNDVEQNVLSSTLGSLYVRLAGGAATSQSSSVQTSVAASVVSASSNTAAGGASSTAASTVFTLLQVQGLRVTTEGSSVYLAWDALPSSELVGYNVYYGTDSGQYIQRRGVDKNATSMTIRALPIGTTYYFAIRGVNGANEETVFSQEVGISVGNPRTSTAPLTGSITKTPGTDGQVAGETGLSSTLVMLITFSAAIGTIIAFRRQFRSS